MAEEVKPTEPVVNEVKYTPENLPKSKGEWDALKTKDPVLFGDLTQISVDRLWKENKEKEEKLKTYENQFTTLKQEVDYYKTARPSEVVIPTDTGIPKTEDEWNTLAIENPTRFHDLRTKYALERENQAHNFNKVWEDSQKEVWTEFPDMYLPELAADGKPKLDDKGMVVLKRDVSGRPIYDPTSEKGKLWEAEYARDPSIANAQDGPLLLMARVQRRLKQKGNIMVNDAAEQARIKAVNDGQVVAGGITPPASTVHKFASESERLHVEKAIARGTYASADEYFRNKTAGTGGFMEENRMPDFTKK